MKSSLGPVLETHSSPTLALEAQYLSRSFRRRSRSPGLQAALKAFFNPSYTEKMAVHQVNFQVKVGACVGLVGANGAGKTTLLKLAAGLLHPTQGSIEVLGFTPSDRKKKFLKKIGMVLGQKSQLWTDIPARDTFELLRSIYQVPKNDFEERLQDLSTLFNVEALLGVQVRKLSLGERMKLEIIAALLHKPELLFLDEPTIGLDLIAQHTIREFIRNYRSKFKTTILLSSHDMEDIVQTCDQLLVIAQGQIRYNGTVSDFQSRPESFTIEMRKLIAE